MNHNLAAAAAAPEGTAGPNYNHTETTPPQPPRDGVERLSWWAWMADEPVWEALTRCTPWPTPHRVAAAYRQLFNRPPEVGGRGCTYRYSRAEILGIAQHLQQKTTSRRVRRGVGQ